MEQEKISPEWNVRLPFIFAALIAFGMFVGTKLPRYDKHITRLSGEYSTGSTGTLEELIGYIDARYVDSTNTDALKSEAIAAFLEGLDPHSVYISREEVEGVAEEMEGQFDGIGVEFLIVEDTIQVVMPLAGGPSETAGIQAGDRVVTINDSLVAGVKIDNGLIYKKLRGSKGSKVKLGIRRNQESSLRFFDIKRDAIPIHSVDVAYLLDPQTVYIKVNKFSATTAKEFFDGITPLTDDQTPRDLVLDLRGNPGGYLEQACELLSQFFPENKLLVFTEGRVDAKEDYKSTGRQKFLFRNVAVLIDEGSASASEIVAGAIQDHDRGWIIGRRSFGKGLVQEQYPLRDGSAVRLTVARYFTPSGRCIQKDYKKDREHYADDYQNRASSGELTDQSKMKIIDTTVFYTAGGRKVFAGGGIIPDYFIPLDTSFVNDYFFDVRSTVLAQFAQKMVDNKQVTNVDNLDSFIKNWQPTAQMMDDLANYAEKNGTKKQPNQFAKSKNELAQQLKARLGKVLFKDLGLYRVLNDDDAAIEKALSILKKGEPVAGNR
jgi:carboxyl-terminal processing protease